MSLSIPANFIRCPPCLERGEISLTDPGKFFPSIHQATYGYTFPATTMDPGHLAAPLSFAREACNHLRHQKTLQSFSLERCTELRASGRAAIVFIDSGLKSIYKDQVDPGVIKTASFCFYVFSLICNSLVHQQEVIRPELVYKVNNICSFIRNFFLKSNLYRSPLSDGNIREQFNHFETTFNSLRAILGQSACVYDRHMTLGTTMEDKRITTEAALEALWGVVQAYSLLHRVNPHRRSKERSQGILKTRQQQRRLEQKHSSRE
ncbi:uncharacterized protein EKO05_0008180 [Ascochyta rabiei]|uniref:uncharacterized protein n=1 Tax=Didymella rabiei TaxID=5454 RepID=UPI002203934A|nr:uncharacterized protein EKO05_0008180 [Ascochyta rabiei]UPX17853.1 hypothetical protein EKO05_0008180 [Ascochyta rabiei]